MRRLNFRGARIFHDLFAAGRTHGALMHHGAHGDHRAADGHDGQTGPPGEDDRGIPALASGRPGMTETLDTRRLALVSAAQQRW
jgi:hypothetical protein